MLSLSYEKVSFNPLFLFLKKSLGKCLAAMFFAFVGFILFRLNKVRIDKCNYLAILVLCGCLTCM